MSISANQDLSKFDALPYTREALVEELGLLERHMRDGTAYICGCAFDSHLPLIAGLASEGVKFAASERERNYYEGLRDWAHKRIGDLETEKGVKAEYLIKESRDRRLAIRYEEFGMKSELPEKGTGLKEGTAREGSERGKGTSLSDPQREKRHATRFTRIEKKGCNFWEEKIHHKQFFARKSFRTLCPECPGARCSNCPPSMACATRVIVGCPKGHYRGGKCNVGMETHVVAHGKAA